MEDNIKKEIISKAGFPIYADYWDKYFLLMSGDQVKEVFRIIFIFNKTFQIEQSNDLAITMVVNTIVDNLKRDAEKRIKQSKANRENGKSGGRPSNEQKVANASKSKQTLKQTLKQTGKRNGSNTETETETEIETKKETENKYQYLVDGLKFVLENKMNKKITTNNWINDFRKLIDIDLKTRTSGELDVKQAINEISNHYGDKYFPIIQSAQSFRDKFTKIENFIFRNKQVSRTSEMSILSKIANKYHNE